MVQKSSEFTTQQLGQHLAQTLGQPLSEQELSNCIKLLEILQPSAGKLFWQSADATFGIYIVLAGKVRRLDHTDNLIASVGAGASFGENTLFPEEHFQPYAARASVNLKLCYVPGACLRSLIRKYPSLGQHFYSGGIGLSIDSNQRELLGWASHTNKQSVLALLPKEQTDLTSLTTW